MRFLCWIVLAASTVCGQFFVGASGGIATLSADATKTGSPPTSFSQYKPENGPTVSVFAGRDFNGWFSVQAGYGWNRNSVLLAGGTVAGTSYEIPTRAVMHTIAAEAMLYFRARDQRFRPYLAAGPGVTVFRGTREAIPAEFNSSGIALRVSVGIDIRVRGPAAFRYTFGETIQSNPLSKQLIPPASRNLANFQNQWGFVWKF